MRNGYRGLAAALLFVFLFLVTGCSRRQEVYLTGLESELEAERRTTEKILETESEMISGYVHICGAVQEPGVYPVYEGMRLFQVLELAGGLAQNADEQWINLAQSITDGQQIYIYTEEETARLKEKGVTVDQAVDSSASERKSDNRININTADKDALMQLPGIGEAKADAIISYREMHGGFGSVEEIQNISGIKSAVFSQIKDRITV